MKAIKNGAFRTHLGLPEDVVRRINDIRRTSEAVAAVQSAAQESMPLAPAAKRRAGREAAGNSAKDSAACGGGSKSSASSNVSQGKVSLSASADGSCSAAEAGNAGAAPAKAKQSPAAATPCVGASGRQNEASPPEPLTRANSQERPPASLRSMLSEPADAIEAATAPPLPKVRPNA